jgi:hypothetical protein
MLYYIISAMENKELICINDHILVKSILYIQDETVDGLEPLHEMSLA